MKKIIISLFLFIATTLAFVLPVSADTGPKPYLDISITNLEKSDYILGLIFFKENHGPHIAYDIENEHRKTENLDTLLSKVQLADGEHLFDIATISKNTTEINIHIGYYPPEDFKVILYDEISDQITISDKYSLYAFASYYKTDATLSLKKNYNYTKEVIGLIVRILLTVLIELSLAILFKFTKKSLIIIGVINVVTQIILNICLNVYVYYNGKFLFYVFPIIILIEILVFVIEALLYKLLCERCEKGKKGIILYTFVANMLSFLIGLLIFSLI